MRNKKGFKPQFSLRSYSDQRKHWFGSLPCLDPRTKEITWLFRGCFVFITWLLRFTIHKLIFYNDRIKMNCYKKKYVCESFLYPTRQKWNRLCFKSSNNEKHPISISRHVLIFFVFSRMHVYHQYLLLANFIFLILVPVRE